MFSFDKYHYYVDGKNSVHAVSTYAGRSVRGTAKVDPQDNFDLEAGKKLAAARCNLKVAQKRAARAKRKRAEAEDLYEQMQARFRKMVDYQMDSDRELVEAKALLAQIESEM